MFEVPNSPRRAVRFARPGKGLTVKMLVDCERGLPAGLHFFGRGLLCTGISLDCPGCSRFLPRSVHYVFGVHGNQRLVAEMGDDTYRELIHIVKSMRRESLLGLSIQIFSRGPGKSNGVNLTTDVVVEVPPFPMLEQLRTISALFHIDVPVDCTGTADLEELIADRARSLLEKAITDGADRV